MSYLVAGRLIWKSDMQKVKPKPNSRAYQKCTVYISVLKTDCIDFASESKTIMIVSWKERAEELARLKASKRGGLVEVFFN